MTDLEKLIVQNFAQEMTKKDNFLCEVIDNYNKLQEENEKYKQYLLNVGMIIEELEQQYDDIKDFTEIKEIKEILNEVQQ